MASTSPASPTAPSPASSSASAAANSRHGRRPTAVESGDSKDTARAAAVPLHDEVVAAQAQDILTAMLLLRWAGAFFVRTFFQPDEYFQALEPAWQLVHGPASGAWLTWEWRHHLRTSLHPVLFAAVYAAVEGVLVLLHVVGPLRALVLVAAPGLAQASLTALGDVCVWRLAGQLYGHGHAATWAALWLAVTSPWQMYCGARTFSNGLEATLTVAALACWPWQLLDGAVGPRALSGSIGRLRLSLLLAATAVVLRPTNLLIWLGLLTVVVTRLTLDGPVSSASSASSASSTAPGFLPATVLLRLLAESAGCGAAVLALAALSDRLYYGAWTLPAYNFLDVNLTQDVAVFYGRSPWHYYLSQGLPLLTTTALPFALYALYAALTETETETAKATPKTAEAVAAAAAAAVTPESPGLLLGAAPDPTRRANARKALAFAVVAAVSALSLVAHKEVRFLHPLLPILFVLAAPHVASFFAAPEATPAPSGAAPGATGGLRRKKLLVAGLAVNAVLATYLSLFHQPAPLRVLTFLRTEYERIHHDQLEGLPPPVSQYASYPAAGAADAAGDNELFALFLMPCHSTPWRAHLVYPGLRARALTCEPPLATPPRSPERAAYRDEADRFYDALAFADDDPAASTQFLATELWPRDHRDHSDGKAPELPRYIVGFEGIETLLTRFFASDDPAAGGGGAGFGVQLPLRRAWTGWNGFFNEDWRRRGAMVVWDTGVFSNASHPNAVRTFDV